MSQPRTIEELVSTSPTMSGVRLNGYTADDVRAAYAPTPMHIRRLFTRRAGRNVERDTWLVNAITSAAEMALYEVPQWAVDLVVYVTIPTIKCDPWKSLGSWRINASQGEWYVHSGELA